MLVILREACIESAKVDTFFGSHIQLWKASNKLTSPLAGYCIHVSLIVRAVFGGNLIEGDVNGLHHFWNRLPSGEEVDLTSCQFGGDGFTPVAKGSIANIPRPINMLYLNFCREVLKKTAKET